MQLTLFSGDHLKKKKDENCEDEQAEELAERYCG
jgi:hypothetical protein